MKKTADRYGLSSDILKYIACAAMLIDHSAVIFAGADSSVWRYIGRLAFPVFAYLLGEGARRTRKGSLYLLRLSAFALLSEIPFDLAFHGKILEFSSQNVFFTLALGLMSVECLRFLQKKKAGFSGILSTLVFASAAMLIKSDYGFMGIITITLLYVFSDKTFGIRLIGSAVAITMLMFAVTGFSMNSVFIVPSQKWGLFALIPIMLYNGKKGRRMPKYFFYAFYPCHIILLYLIKLIIT